MERRTINDQEATDTILVHGVFIMFFFYCYWYTTIASCIILTQKCSLITTQLSLTFFTDQPGNAKSPYQPCIFRIRRSTTIKFKVMSREYFPIWKIHFLIKILSLFQGNTLTIGDIKYVRLFDNDLHIAYSEIRYQDVIITFEFLR